ncbi:nucleotide exchange factor GrpE [Anaeromyxobacter paludicola]|uniref:Protein GrpE n=1 Tax=Anaeromyxobacter paludicola TaxID=2918171 RepID=A0ABM7X789_9BACT|nr:nucleotide exchange factor GrpE [Anaeromyxobacter paludicola]BDG07689.1 protein GrpE [Anaeromyxobacter paludicola]
MPEEQQPGAFQNDPRQDPEPGAGAPPRPEQGGAPPDDRDARLSAQAARIDELTRAYAALVEETKAYRARMERERTRVLEAERLKIVEALLEGLDELDRALAAAHGSQGPLAEGVRLTHQALSKRVAELGATRLALVGQRFDPAVAEAVDVVPVADESQDDQVVQEVRSGWRIGERVLRPARVRVGRLARA